MTHRIIKTKQWKQLGIIAKLLIISTCNLLFYLGALGWLEQGLAWGIYGGLYIIIALILTMGRRVVPFFIERATHDSAQLFNAKWVDISSLLFFFIFSINEVFYGDASLSAYSALILFIINSFRLIGWHNPIIWQQGLLWSIYLSFWLITFGFLLFALPYFAAPYIEVSKFIAIHAFTIGGIATMTLGMMSRVALAHTGRNVYQPPKAMIYAFAAILISAIIRVVLPLFDICSYALLVGLSQGFWIAAFFIFFITYTPILLKKGL